MKPKPSRKRFTPSKPKPGGAHQYSNPLQGPKKTGKDGPAGPWHRDDRRKDPHHNGSEKGRFGADGETGYFHAGKKKPVNHQRLKPGEGKSRLPRHTGTYQESPKARGEEMPLNKYIAHCGICSRRKAAELVKEGKVTVNGAMIGEPAFKVTAKDSIKLNGQKISLQKTLVYVLLNKPKGFLTTTNDPEGRRTVMELVQDAAEERIFPVGRLDRNTSGLLLLTNDGELAQKLAHPSHQVKKLYQVELNKPLTKADFEKIVKGVELEDGIAAVDALGFTDEKDKRQVGIEIHSGKNRIVRRIFEHLDYTVEKLDRVLYAGLTKKNIPRGKWRFLTEKEVIFLKHFK